MKMINWDVRWVDVNARPNEEPYVGVQLYGTCDETNVKFNTREIKGYLEERLNAIDPYAFQKALYKIDYTEYYRKDIDMTKQLVNSVFGAKRLDIKKVIFNDPATIVMWGDGTKTVVKCSENDIFDPEKGLAMAITKKALGNQGNYNAVIKKWTKDYEWTPKDDVECVYPDISKAFSDFLKGIETKAERDV